MSQTNAQKAAQILGALDLPEGHYAVERWPGDSLVAEVSLSPGLAPPFTDLWMNIYMSTAVWFQLYESTVSGIVWTLCMPDPNNESKRCNPPRLEYKLLGITIRAMYDRTDVNARMSGEDLSEAIANAEKIDGIPVID